VEVHNHAGAFATEGTDHLVANASGRPGDENDALCQADVHIILLLARRWSIYLALADAFGFAENFISNLRTGLRKPSSRFCRKRAGKPEKLERISGQPRARVLL
jgi:hypothetical protein